MKIKYTAGMIIEFDTIIELDDEEEPIEVWVTADFRPGSPGSFYARNGDPGNPPEPDDCEITKIIKSIDGKPLVVDDLPDHIIDDLIEQTSEQYANFETHEAPDQ